MNSQQNKNSSWAKITICSLIFCFWLFMILVFVWTPHLISSFYKQKSITVLTWPTLLDAQFIESFEKETGIKVNIRYFDNNEELFVKMKNNKGDGYDLIMPSDYMVDVMIKENLLKKLDTTKLEFFDQFHPHLVGNFYDVNNNYSVPYFWSIYGIAYNKEHFPDKKPMPSWSSIFDGNHMESSMCMIDKGRDLMLIAAQYLYGRTENLNEHQLQEIEKLLIKQKKFVGAYCSEDRAQLQ